MARSYWGLHHGMVLTSDLWYILVCILYSEILKFLIFACYTLNGFCTLLDFLKINFNLVNV